MASPLTVCETSKWLCSLVKIMNRICDEWRRLNTAFVEESRENRAARPAGEPEHYWVLSGSSLWLHEVVKQLRLLQITDTDVPAQNMNYKFTMLSFSCHNSTTPYKWQFRISVRRPKATWLCIVHVVTDIISKTNIVL